MEQETQNSLFTAPGKPAVKIFGVGNAGIHLLGALAVPEFAGAQLVAVNTDGSSLAATTAATVKIHLENKLLRGMGSGGDPERGRALAEEQFSTLKSACEGAGVVFILAGLGGGSGSGISPILARAAREAGALALAFVTMPFDCEGGRRESQAQQALEHLKSAADGVICLPSQKIFKLIDENTSLVETFRATNGFLIEGLRGIWQLITRPGLIQVHFADLCGMIRDRHTESAFAYVEASGAARSREVVDKIMAHPLLDEGKALADSDAVLVSLMAGKDLTMAEVNRVIEQIKRQCGHAQIIMGAAVDPDLKSKLCVTVIAARQPIRSTGTSARVEGRTGSMSASIEKPAPIMRGSRARQKVAKQVQGQLPLTIISKGRFDKSEPTLHHGEDLDVPTFLRRGIALN